MADLVTRLLLKNEQFNSAINTSSAQVRKFESRAGGAGKSVANFQGQIGNLASKAGTSFMKLSGYAGLAVGGVEALEKVMRGSQTTSDAFDNTINAAKNSVDMFFTSISRGDWAPFQSGILDAFKNLKDLSATLDELADKKLSLSVIRADKLNEIEKYEEIARDTNKTIDERTEAVKKLHTAIDELRTKTKETSDFEADVLLKSYNISSGLNFTKDDLREFAEVTNFTGKATAEASAAYKEYLRLEKEYDKDLRMNRHIQKDKGFTDKTKQEAQENFDKINTYYKAYIKENEELIKQGWLTEENDKKRQATLKTLIEQFNIEREISTLEKRANRTERSVNTAAKGESDKKEKAEKEAREKKEKAIKEIDDLSLKAQNEIESEFAKIVNLWDNKNVELIKKNPFAPVVSFKASEEEQDITGSIKDTEEQIQALTLSYNEATTDALRKMYAQRRDDLEKHLEEITDVNNGMIDIAGEINNLMGGAITNAFSSIGDAIGSGDAGAAMKSMLLGMMDLLEQFGAALVAAGVASLALKSVLANPFAAIAAGGALIVTVGIAKAAINSAQDFAEGGILYGETYAHVAEYAGASTNPEVIAPLNKLRELIRPQDNNESISGDVTFRIKGDALVGILNNHNHKKERKG